MDVYPLVLPHKVRIYIEGLRVLYLRWWKRKVIRGMFKWLGYKYGGFYRTWEGKTLGGVWTTGGRIESMRGGKGKLTKLEIGLIDLWDTLPRVQAASWWYW